MPADPAAMQAPTKFHDVTVIKRKTIGRARVQGVPPEECGIERQARSIRDCGYFFHRVTRREADLIAEGFDEVQIKALPTYVVTTGVEETARDTVAENTGTGGDKGANTANRFVRIVEHYVRMDYEQNNKVKLYRVTTGGEVGEILKKDGEVLITEEDDIPFASMTPVIVTHRFFGRSIADLVLDIQRIKTALTRGLLDNTYLAVNPRPIISETDSSESTIDDTLISRPGAPIRGKTPNCVTWSEMPAITDKILPAIEYMDAQREWRSGVSRQGQGLDPETLQNQSATAGMLQFTATQAKMKLIARIFAETGIRDMFSLLHETIRKHTSESQVYRLRNKWINVDPRDWKRRDDMTINVGLGGGGRGEQVAFANAIIQIQAQALAGGKTNLVSDLNLYNSAQELAKAMGHKDGDKFFTDPRTVPPPQAAPDPKLMEVQMKAQADQQKSERDAQLKLVSMQTDYEHQKAKGVADAALNDRKMALDELKAQREHEYKLIEMDRNHQYKLAELAAKSHAHAQDTAVSSQAHANDTAVDVEKGKAQDHLTPLLTELMEQLRKATAPKRIVRGPDGRVSHVEPIH